MKAPTNRAMPELETAAEVENGKTAMKTQAENGVFSTRSTGSSEESKLNERYGCGPVELTGTPNALYERHLVFDNVMDVTAIGARERFEAVARSVRDVLSQRWIRTEKTYERKDPKHAFTIFRWNFSWVALWLTTSRIFYLMTRPKRPSRKRSSIGTSCSIRSRTQVWATEG
jgi:hypothetical protein